VKNNSRISGFYKFNLKEKIEKISECANLTKEDIEVLKTGGLSLEKADKVIENVIGLFNLPFGVALNFLINNKDYIIPMTVEEPSVVAAASHAAKIIRDCGGFVTDSDESIMIGQIQVVNCENFEESKQEILERKDEIINLANKIEPQMFKRGGGAKDVEVRILGDKKVYPYSKMLIVHLLIDVKDAMGANLINSMVEGVSSLIEEISHGKVYLKILSNLTDKRLARAKTIIFPKALQTKDYRGEEIIEGILQAYYFAYLDPYRASTHNKGVMNGIDPVVIATGNDWRAIEAGAHAYACRKGNYLPLTTWERDDIGNLVGYIEIPMAVGIVGGATKLHPISQIALKILGVKSARELGEVIACVGLAQNLTAIKALATEGIQRGHMALHARSVALTAGAKGEIVDIIAKELINQKNIKVDKAKEILENMLQSKI